MGIKKTEKKYKKMMKELKDKGFYRERMNTSVSIWYPDKENIDFRFLVLPDIYKIAEKYWKADQAPFVVELLYSMDIWCHKNKFDNLLGLILTDFAIEQQTRKDCGKHADKDFSKKMNLLAVAFHYQNKNSTTEVAFLLDEMKLNYKEILDIALKIHSKDGVDPMIYFEQVVNPCIYAIMKDGARSELFDGIDMEKNASFGLEEIELVVQRLNVSEALDKQVVLYLVNDVLDYVLASDCNCYNPYWIFGSKYYKILTKRVWKYN